MVSALRLPFVIALGACAGAGEQGPAATASGTLGDSGATAEPVAAISAREQLVRLSMQLAGRRAPAEWVLAADDPVTFEAALSALLDDPALGFRAAFVWNEQLHLAAFGEDGSRWQEIDGLARRSLNWEPLAGVMAVVNEDRPMSDLVTAQEWPANEDVAEVTGRAWSGEPGEWVALPYADGRPMAGMLSTAGLWARHAADATNYHRRRANLVARVFVCADFFDRDVNFELATADVASASVEDAVRTDGACTTCHASLDPLAGFFGGFGERSEPSELRPWLQWSPALADFSAASFTPGWYGVPAADLSELGPIIADDPRFPRCIARRTYEWLTGADFAAEPDRERIVVDFVEGGLVFDALVRSIVATPAWAAPGDNAATADQIATAATAAYALPMGDWGVWAGVEDAVFDGELRALSGDTDDETVLVRNSSRGSGMQLATDWVTRAVVVEAMKLDQSRAAADRQLLPSVDDPDEAALRTHLAGLYLRFTSREVEPDGGEVDRLLALYNESGGGEEGWSTVLVALGRHPDVVRF